jgi:hypothetical protein
MTSITGIAAAAAALLAGAFIEGCATESPPSAQLAASETAIAMARDSGAAQHAARELELAQGKLQLGRHFLSAGDYKPARWLAEQASADAELAAMKTASAHALATAAAQLAEARRNRVTQVSMAGSAR